VIPVVYPKSHLDDQEEERKVKKLHFETKALWIKKYYMI
jgi:hypothetical protein